MLNANTDSGFKNGTPSKAIQIHCDCIVDSLQDVKACVSNDPNPLLVDLEFSAMIPPLRSDERLLLEENLLRDGCRDALVVWAEENILLDGHNRLEICCRLNIPYETVGISCRTGRPPPIGSTPTSSAAGTSTRTRPACCEEDDTTG